MKNCRDNFLPLLCGLIVSSVLTLVVIMTTWDFGVVYERRIQLFDLAVCIIWLALLIRGRGWKQYKFWEIAVAIFFFVCLAAYMGNAWHMGYITDTPLIAINAETDGIGRDTLYHNALASSIEYYGYPSLLVNTKAFHDYHFGSHIILGLISKFMRMPTIFTYCYLYPVIFFPLLPSLVLSVAYDIRNQRGLEKGNAIIDIIVLLGFMTYYSLPKSLSDAVGDGKAFAWLISESFCVAIVLGLILFKIWVYFAGQGLFVRRIIYESFIVIVVPFFIFIITLTKISVGLIVTFMICYYLFREKGMAVRYLLLELFYMAIVFSVHYLPTRLYSPFPSGTNSGFKPMALAYMRNNYDPRMWGIHILALFLYAIVFIAYRLKDISTIND